MSNQRSNWQSRLIAPLINNFTASPAPQLRSKSPLSGKYRTGLAIVGLSLGVAALPVYAVGNMVRTSATQPSRSLLQSSPSQVSQKGPVEITLVSYAVTKEAYGKIIPKFRAKWKKETGQDVKINESYGGSGSQTRAVIDGLEADVVALALEFDTDKIQSAGLIKPGWEKEVPNQGIVTKSVIALITRPGNPKKITKWDDLAKPGIGVITANPKTSGIARWNFLGIWNSQIANGEAKAKDFVGKVFKNVSVLAKDAREASDIFFKKGQGDVLLNYENEAILESQRGDGKGFVVTVPQTNVSIDAPVAVVDKVVDKRGTRKVSEAFVKYLFTEEAQRDFVSVGFRSVNPTVAKATANQFPKVDKLSTIKKFGGWDVAQKKFFADGAVFDQIYAKR